MPTKTRTKKLSKKNPLLQVPVKKEDRLKTYRGHWQKEIQEHKAELRGEVINPSEFRSGKATWRIFRIMAEFVEGYDFLSKLTADITIFGSARIRPGSKYYHLAEEICRLLAKKGFSIVTGGGPGIMEAANKGAYEAGGESIGINIQLPFEQRINDYVHHGMGFHFFFTRKVMLTSPAQAFIAFPGGYGTMNEIFEVLTLIQTHKMQPVPIILVGKEFWGGLYTFIKEQMLDENKAINAKDLELFTIVDSAKEVMEVIKKNVVAHDNAPEISKKA
ncbi:MAG TPA: TIGR00730 family Rossman fold protein [Patescibacteria group bacterium]|nr:TIGR00730 family Rossman fold protein [Patescibacteria group bacterium]